ncbi:uncharacterized protein LOC128242634 [Mya arenaria]|uniref:uncharacterized protein LOC128242634 n=1 Tax=Mya arenaria TaxID=6604 RepID=UPI0022E02FB4|nr:uncharacterized protein LOC128242634 [Mya arenaria]
MQRLFLRALLFSLWCSLTSGDCPQNGNPWQPEWMPLRNDLLCDERCDRFKASQVDYIVDEYTNCCQCNSCTKWEGQEVNLDIEYTTVSGKGVVLVNERVNDTLVYKTEMRHGELSEIPSNLCGWDKEEHYVDTLSRMNMVKDLNQFYNQIVVINFEYNSVKKLPDLNCLTNLDGIYLKGNKISHLSNTSFQTLSHLRIVDLSLNKIVNMDPNVVFNTDVNVLHWQFENNDLIEVDVTNFLPAHPFCEVDFSGNEIEQLTNKLSITLENEIYGPGFIRLQDNKISTFPDLKTLFNLESLNQFGTLLSFGFDLRGVPLICDCHMQPYYDLGKNYLEALWRDFFNLTCTAPPSLKDKPVFEVGLYELVCDLHVEDGCPKQCTCIDQPQNNTVFVNCSNKALDKMPQFLPNSTFSEFISLDVSNNFIRNISAPYLDKLVHLDVSNNAIVEIDEDDITTLKEATVVLSENKRLRRLPRNLQYRSMCNTVIVYTEIDCDCTNIWIENWFHAKSCEDQPIKSVDFKCLLPDRTVIEASDFKSDILRCEYDTTLLKQMSLIFSCILLLIVIGGSLLYKFRYEAIVLWLRLNHKSKDPNMYTYDVAVTFNEDDDMLRGWVTRTLIPRLHNERYKVFRTYIDTEFGAHRDDAVAETYAKCRNFVLILSESYLEERPTADEDNFEQERKWTENEWKFAWHQYRADYNKNVLVINYDHISSFNVEHPQIRAVLRVGHVVHFGNHVSENEVLDEVVRKIGPSLRGNQGEVVAKPFFKWKGYPEIDSGKKLVESQNEMHQNGKKSPDLDVHLGVHRFVFRPKISPVESDQNIPMTTLSECKSKNVESQEETEVVLSECKSKTGPVEPQEKTETVKKKTMTPSKSRSKQKISHGFKHRPEELDKEDVDNEVKYQGQSWAYCDTVKYEPGQTISRAYKPLYGENISYV